MLRGTPVWTFCPQTGNQCIVKFARNINSILYFDAHFAGFLRVQGFRLYSKKSSSADIHPA